MAAFERQVLKHWLQGFSVVGAGRDARDFCKALSPKGLRLVRAMHDVDVKKIGKTVVFRVEDGEHQVGRWPFSASFSTFFQWVLGGFRWF